jgi:RimJ/RimL family protein N-acetyltransferase
MGEIAVPSGKILIGQWVRLDPIGEADFGELGALLDDPRVYEHGYVMHRRPSSAADATELARTTFGGTADKIRYAIRLARDSDLGPAGTLVGTSGLSEIDPRNESTHIGGTLYGSRWWGTQVNPEAKMLLLGHCFDDCGFGRVKIQTDVLNTRSQAAIARLGAVREGVLRRHMRREDGSFRDTVVFSVLKTEWPEVRDRLLSRLTAPQSPESSVGARTAKAANARRPGRFAPAS